MSKGKNKYTAGEELRLEASCSCSSRTKLDEVLDKVSRQIDDEWNQFFVSLQKDTEDKTHYLN